MRPYYSDELVTLYNGDCREITPALGLAFDVAIADPPYTQTSLDWDEWPHGWLDAVQRVTASMWCFGSLRLFMDRAIDFRAAGWSLSQDVVWEKHNGSSFHADRFRRVHEQVAHFYTGAWKDIYRNVPTTNDATARTVRRKERPAHMGHIKDSTYTSHDGGPRLMRSVIYQRSMHGRADNETQKPEGIVAPLMEYACHQKGLVLSPFTGSGTDLIIARMSGRRAVGIEIREDQCEKAARRLSQGVLQDAASR